MSSGVMSWVNGKNGWWRALEHLMGKEACGGYRSWGPESLVMRMSVMHAGLCLKGLGLKWGTALPLEVVDVELGESLVVMKPFKLIGFGGLWGN